MANETSAIKIAAAQRRQMALQLRLQGGSYRSIADVLKQQPGISPKYNQALAYKDVRDELDRVNAENAETAERLRRLQLEQYNTLFAKYWPAANKGDYASFDRILTVMDRIARVAGLYSQTVNVGGRVEQTGTLAFSGAVDLNHTETQIVIYVPDNGRGDRQPTEVQPGKDRL